MNFASAAVCMCAQWSISCLRLTHARPLPSSPAAHPCSGGRGGGGGGRGRRLLNRGMNNGNYIGRRDEGASGSGAGGAEAGGAPQEDDHAHEAALGFPLHTDGPDRLGWLMNLNQVGCNMIAIISSWGEAGVWAGGCMGSGTSIRVVS